MEKVKINTEYIKLDQFLKWAGAAESGAFAKMMVENGDVLVNGQVTEQRGKKLRTGDIIEVRDAGSFEII
jgi:ribosome-associated protein